MDTRLASKFVHTAFAAAILSLLTGGAGVQAQSWSLTGNGGTNPNPPLNNFLGTQDEQPLVIKTYGIEAIHINPGRLGPQTDGRARIPGNVGIGTTNPQARLDVAGMTRTGTLQITGGADLSEHFEVRGAADVGSALLPIQSGLVVSIDPDEPGKLVISSQAYDRKVAGIISGAGDVRPGMLMSQSGSIADGDRPVALTGRVYCWADASYGSITPGDLLTTSDTPGHAMKVTDYGKAQGAVIGKAMAALKQGKGLVLVLVSLQ